MEQTANPQLTPLRAGKYVHQPAGYRAFLPEPLPPNPPVEVGNDLQVLLSQADRALGRLDGSIQTLPNPDLFVYMYVRKEVSCRARSKERKVPCKMCWPRRPTFSRPIAPVMSMKSSTMSAP